MKERLWTDQQIDRKTIKRRGWNAKSDAFSSKEKSECTTCVQTHLWIHTALHLT